MPKLLRKVGNCWCDEFRLVRRIWQNDYPKPEPKKDQLRLSHLEKVVMIVLVLIRAFSVSPLKRLWSDKERRTQCVEYYVIIWWALLTVLLIFPFPSPFYAVLIGYRLVEGFSYRLSIIFVDRYGEEWKLRSLHRSLMLLVVNYFEMIVGFAALYVWSDSIKNAKGEVLAKGNALSDPPTSRRRRNHILSR